MKRPELSKNIQDNILMLLKDSSFEEDIYGEQIIKIISKKLSCSRSVIHKNLNKMTADKILKKTQICGKSIYNLK